MTEEERPSKKELIEAFDALVGPLHEILRLLYRFSQFFRIALILCATLFVMLLALTYWQFQLTLDLEEQRKELSGALSTLQKILFTTTDTKEKVDRADKAAKISLIPKEDAGVSGSGDNALIVIETLPSPSSVPAIQKRPGVKVEIPVKLPKSGKVKLQEDPEK